MTAHGPLADERRTNKPLIGRLVAEGWALCRRRDCGFFAAGALVGAESEVPSERSGFVGNSALDHARSLSSERCSGREGGGVRAADGVSSKASRASIPVSFGILKSGASPFATELRTASANFESGRSQEP